MSLDEYFDEHTGEHNDDLDIAIHETVGDGLVDVIGERNEKPVFIALGSDDAVYDVGKTLTILQRSPSPRLVQYVTPEPHSLVVESLTSYLDDDLECYAASMEHGVMRFSPYGQASSTSPPSVASYLIDRYADSEEERTMLENLVSLVYNE